MNEITVFGVLALTFMMAMYSLEGRHRRFTLAFALGCLLSSPLRKFQFRRDQPCPK
jgi:hypothetical protein